ncbi:MAG: hypothetical protein EXR45_03245 [Chloroflexi bacterium]|nr:hypothetical protein [Chloroflexota bacterium]
MVAREIADDTATDETIVLPTGFSLRVRTDERTLPAQRVFDLYRGEQRVAWGLRTLDAAVRWGERLGGSVRASERRPVPARRLPSSTPWWLEKS